MPGGVLSNIKENFAQMARCPLETANEVKDNKKICFSVNLKRHFEVESFHPASLRKDFTGCPWEVKEIEDQHLTALFQQITNFSSSCRSHSVSRGGMSHYIKHQLRSPPQYHPHINSPHV